MFIRPITAVVAGAAMILAAETANAACGGAPASKDSLAEFQKAPANWLSSGAKNPATDIRALAVAASASPDLSNPSGPHYANFQNAVKTMLGGANADQGKAMGTALGSLAAGCSKIGPEETAFISALQTAVAQSGNLSADTAYGKALNEQQTASTGNGGGGGASTGVGGATGVGGGTGGGSNSGSTAGTPNPGTPVTAQNLFTSQSGGANSGTLTGATGTTTTSTTTTVTNGQIVVTDH